MGELDEWAKREVKADEERKKRVYNEKGFKKFFKVPEGITTLEVLGVPRTVTGDYGTSTVFPANLIKGKKKERVDWAINVKSFSLLRMIKAALAKGETVLRVTRTGTGGGTRYKVEQV